MGQQLFFGAWSPDPASFQFNPPLPPQWTLVRGNNWVLVGSCDGNGDENLVHGDRDQASGVAFRGYLLDPPLVHWSDSRRILDFWLGDARSVLNGVFSVASCASDVLRLGTDAFGISPLYVNGIGDVVLFGTHPGFVGAEGDVIDQIATHSIAQCTYVTADRTLLSGVKRVPPGEWLSFRRGGVHATQWYDFSRIAEPDVPLSRASLDRVHDAMSVAVDRCLRIPYRHLMLPLSGGHDSRRILAHLVQSGTAFRATTVRVPSKGRDVDAPAATRLASEFGFPHELIELPPAAQVRSSEAEKRWRVFGETRLHDWAVALARSFPVGRTLVLDGLAGDVLGETGFMDLGLHSTNETGKLEKIAGRLVRGELLSKVRPGTWPSVDQARHLLVDWLSRIPAGRNRADIAFLLLQTRRSTALMSQQMFPAGTAAIYPYLDLDYVHEAFRLDPESKLEASLQQRCLEEFFPRIGRFPGTRSPASEIRQFPEWRPARSPPNSIWYRVEELPARSRFQLLASLSWGGNAALFGSCINARLAQQNDWWLGPLVTAEWLQSMRGRWTARTRMDSSQY